MAYFKKHAYRAAVLGVQNTITTDVEEFVLAEMSIQIKEPYSYGVNYCDGYKLDYNNIQSMCVNITYTTTMFAGGSIENTYFIRLGIKRKKNE